MCSVFVCSKRNGLSLDQIAAEKEARKRLKSPLPAFLLDAEDIDEEVIVYAACMFVGWDSARAGELWAQISGIDEAAAMIGYQEPQVCSGFWRDR